MMENNAMPFAEDTPVAIEFDGTMLRVTLKDGREIATPLAWYPRLASATEEERQDYRLSAVGIHWAQLDEDLSVQGMLRGVHSLPAQSARTSDVVLG